MWFETGFFNVPLILICDAYLIKKFYEIKYCYIPYVLIEFFNIKFYDFYKFETKY